MAAETQVGTSPVESLADHVADSVESLASFHREHYRQASGLQRAIDRVTDALGRPIMVLAMVVALAAWITITAVLTGGHVDQPAFAWLELMATLAALLIAMMILVTQRREDLLAERRAQLTLELALLADKKIAKTISLLEELRRDQPDISDRVDQESQDMAEPTDPKAVLNAIDHQTERG